MQVINYLKSYGNFSFEEKPFNEIDGAIIACLAYIPFETVDEKTISNKKLSDITSKIEVIKNCNYDPDFNVHISQLWDQIPQYQRFNSLVLTSFIIDTNHDIEKQFGAITLTSDKNAYVAFRGSDLTMTSWKENFRLSYDVVIPAQLDAVAYLNVLSRDYTNVIICGHSKGANLSIYSALNCTNKDRISDIYFYDGPGLDDKSLNSDEWKIIKEKIHAFMPKQSIISMVYGHGIPFNIIKSSGRVIQQHDLLRWYIKDNKFVRVMSSAFSSKLVYNFFHELKYTLSKDEIETFLNSVFRATENMEINTIDEFVKDPTNKIKELKKHKNDLSDEERKLYKKVKKILINSSKDYSKLKINVQNYKVKKAVKQKYTTSTSSFKHFFLKNIIFPNVRVSKLFDTISKNHYNQIAVTDANRSVTRKELKELYNKAAKELKKLNVKSNSMIAINLPNCIEAIALYFAINSIGANCVILDNSQSSENLANEIEMLKIDYLISSKNDFYNLINGKVSVSFANKNSIKGMLVLYTSGSTGQKKRMMFTNSQILYAMMYFASTGAKLYDPRLHNSLSVVPFMYPYGFICSAIFPLIGGCHITLALNLNPTNVNKYFNENLNLVYLVPSMLKMVAKNLDENTKLNGLTTVFSGGDILTEKDNIKILKIFKNHGATKASIYNSCGNGEILGCATTSYGCDYRPDTVGKLVPGVEGCVLDNNHQKLAIGKAGMLAIHGKHIFEGYYENKQATDECLVYLERKKFYLTGIVGFFDDDGYFTILGRDRRFYITTSKTGELKKVYCEHVSDCIEQLGFVEKCCVCVFEIDNQSQGAAFIVLNKTYKDNKDVTDAIENELYKLLKKKHVPLNDYEIPKKYMFVDKISLTKANKIDYKKMQEITDELFT